MALSSLSYWILHPESLNRDTLYELRTLLARYPYCQSLRLLFLKNLYLLHDISFGAELRKSALYVADRRMLFYLIEGDKYKIQGVNKGTTVAEIEEEPGLDRTLSLIDSFLSKLPAEEDNLTVDNIQYISDYTTYLEQLDESEEIAEESDTESLIPNLNGQELIDNFINKAETESMVFKPSDMEDEAENITEQFDSVFHAEEEDETYFTETLAIIYIKQKRYSKAIEIIKKLSLKYPKKNVYFADQIRFLEKLIINAKS